MLASKDKTISTAIMLLTAVILSLGGITLAEEEHNNPAPALSPDEQALFKNKKYQQALKSLSQGLPLEASKIFQECLNSKQIPDTQKAIIRPFFAESLIRAKKTQEGLTEWASLPASPLKSYWTAVGLFNKGSFIKALEELVQIPETDPLSIYAAQLKAQLARQLDDQELLVNALNKLSAAENATIAQPSQILLADTLARQHKFQEATETLNSVKTSLLAHQPPSQLLPYAQLAEGRLFLNQNLPDQAITTFTAIIANPSYPEKIRDASRLSLARAEILREKNNPGQAEKENRNHQETDPTHTAGTGDDRLITFIGGKAESSLLMDAFNILLEEGTFKTDPQAQEKLTSWVNTKDSGRQPAAMYAMGCLLLEKNDLTSAVNLAEKGITAYPQSIPVQTLCLNTITALLQNNRTEEGERLIKKYPAHTPGILFQQGALAFRKGDYPLTQQLFHAAAQQGTDKTSSAALFNQNLAALHANDGTDTAAILKEASTSPKLQEQILFEQAHYAAKRANPQAVQLLQRFISLSTEPQLKTQAQMDLAEVELNLAPPNVSQVKNIIALLEKEPLTEEQTLQLARLKILLSEHMQEWSDAIQACRQAIASDKEGKHADILHLKLGELLYKNGDFHEAQLVLQPFPSKYPDSPLESAAFFLAGKAAQQSNTDSSLQAAQHIFQTLGAGKTPFAQSARIEEASVLLRMGKADQCIATLNTLLEQPLPRYMRLLALSIQADAWVTKEDTNSETLKKAISLCTEILSTPKLGLAWKFKALTQRAQFYERLNTPEKALDDYAEILAHTPSGDSANKRRDWHWFYNAGFASIRILEQRQDWSTAFALAKKLAQTSGPRSREAAAYARRIQLEHFIWQDETPTKEAPSKSSPGL